MEEADERTWIVAKDGSIVLKISKVGWVSKDERNISRKADQRLGSGTGYIKNTNAIMISMVVIGAKVLTVGKVGSKSEGRKSIKNTNNINGTNRSRSTDSISKRSKSTCKKK